MPKPESNKEREDKCLVLLVADQHYLIPTLIVAFQIRDAIVRPEDVDVIVYVTSPRSSDMDAASRHAQSRGVDVRYWLLPDTEDAQLDFTSHVSPATLGRLFIAEELSDEYSRLIYVDGDVQITGNISDFLNFVPPDNMLVASVDSVAACINPKSAHGQDFLGYISNLGINEIDQYFNAGILCCKLSTWKSTAREAIAYIRSHPDRCRFHDQSALNAVMRGKWLPMHPRFNYGPIYQEIGAPFDPEIFHFHGPDKPWTESMPFGCDLAAPYAAIRRDLPFLPGPADNGRIRHLGNPYSPSRLIRNARRRHRLKKYLRKTDFVLE